MKAYLKSSTLNSITLLTSVCLLSDSKAWPYILMGNAEFEMRLVAYDKIYGKIPDTVQELEAENITECYKRIVANLRTTVQRLFNSLSIDQEKVDKQKAEMKAFGLAKQEKHQEKVRLEKVGKDFIKNNIVDYGTETVTQIATRLNISKAEVRRRKQNGETL